MSRIIFFAVCISMTLSLCRTQASGQIVQQQTQDSSSQLNQMAHKVEAGPQKVPKEVKVTVEADKPHGVLMPWTMGVHSLASDSHLTEHDVVALLRAAGITTIRYPGGRIADTFHWSTYTASPWQGLSHPNVAYAPTSDPGAFLRFMEQVGTAIVTVNYGSNARGDGGGEPAEAAAWVAYVNGNPSDTKEIGKDSTGNDWKTVGYWASLRASAPWATDDGKNFLRLQHPAPFGIHFWEIGNQVYQNGYYGGEGLEEDAHAPYPELAANNEHARKKNANLSPAAYAKNFLEFAKAMKAVDPKIHLGIPLNPSVTGQINRQEWTQDTATGKYVQNTKIIVDKDFGFAADWAKNVLPSTCNDLDFVSLPLYAGDTTAASNYKDLDNEKLLAAPQASFAQILSSVAESIQKACGQRARSIRVAITEMGPVPWAKVTEPVAVGLFAADVYLSLAEYGVINVDWAELHSGGFLDEHNTPGPAYFGAQLVFALMNYNDVLLNTSTSSSMLSVHAARRADGAIGVMLINKDPNNATTAKLTVKGATVAAKGARFNYGKTDLPAGTSLAGKAMEGLGTSLSISMPPYTATVIVMPKGQ